MTNKYGEAALLAAQSADGSKDAKLLWESSVKTIFPDSPTARRKGCPKGAFLGLCEQGIIRGIASGSYTKSKKNKQYAITAVNLLRSSCQPQSPFDLWKLVMGGVVKSHNGQMDVVIALWDSGLIE